MITVADFYRYGNEHVPVNASLLFMICKHYSDSPVAFFAEETHLNNVKEFWQLNNIEAGNIEWKPSKIKLKAKGTRLVFERIKNELHYIRRLGKAKTESVNKIFFLSLSPLPTIVYKSFFSKNRQTLITLHGDVEFARMQNSFSRNIIGRLFRISFNIKKQNCVYLALNKVIKQNLIQEEFLKKDEVIAVYHPYIFHDQLTVKPYTTQFKFAHIGVASLEKRSYYLYDIATSFENEIRQQKMQLEIIGKNENIEIKENSELIPGIHNKEMLRRDEFDMRLMQVDYTLFFYSEAYQLTGSGALMDALDFEKPVIALRNQLFETFFNDAGKIGFVCDSVNEVKMIIKQVLSGEIAEDDYRQMQKNIRSFKQEFSLANIEEQLFGQLTATKAWHKIYDL